MFSRAPLSFCLALALSLAAGAAHADPAPAAGKAAAARSGESSRRSRELDKGYTYEFGDDPLAGQGLEVNGVVLRVRTRGLRTQLTQPRLHFVPELLRSVEAL